jgi:hypothetical protein
MITAETFATTNGSYWAEVLPRLEHFVRVSNAGLRVFAEPLDLQSIPARHAFVSETAFALWRTRMVHHRYLHIREAQRIARERLESVRRQVSFDEDLGSDEAIEARAIASRLFNYFTRVRRVANPEIDSWLPGCGPVLGGSPDLLGTDSSYGEDAKIIAEVKSVQRKFRSTDLRQLVVYIVLYFSVNNVIPDVLIVVNPVRGRSLEIDVDSFFAHAAGRAAQEIVPELQFEWSTAGISL